ncbi:flagellar hook capping FlgD N-terminal domain-containing protein [Paracoccus sp. (in: a-proteobacteria)]|uniref:flagellar hook capping FlgD N-terminal domain-containing protein n=1 Tax=Paracoccus sp. TaxID=267 RepID=UPI003A8C2509
MIPAIGTSTPPQPTGGQATAAAGGTNADFNTFLRMLTTQLKNQDPLNPMEGTEFAVQLATFSGVEQQAQTNKLLSQLAVQMGAGGLGQTADWIGKEARTTAPVWFGDKALTLDVAPDPRADDVALVALDASGQEVAREMIGPGAGQVDWYGRDAAGDKLPDGRYSFRVESLRDGEVIADTEASAYARITEAGLGDTGVELIFEGGATAPVSAITALRAGS